MKILLAASECVPFVKVGGLADVVGALPKSLKENGHDVRIIIPKYRKVDAVKFGLKKLKARLIIPIGGNYEEGGIWEGVLDGNIPVYFVENQRYFDRSEVYSTQDGDYADNKDRFIFFSRAVLEASKFIGFQPDVVHCHDWQTGLIPAYLKTLYRIDGFFCNTASVYTIHNIAYQGMFSADTVASAGFSWKDFVWNKLEYFGKFNYMKSAIVYADKISTVSPAYAKEIQFSSEGRGMEAVLRSRNADVSGILNGLDYTYWDPGSDQMIAKNFTSADLSGKAECKKDLQKKCGFPIDKSALLLGVVSRLDPQKGIDLICAAISRVAKSNVQLAVLGTGSRELHEVLAFIQKKNPKKVKACFEYNEPMAHKIYAGADAFLMPSRFEPCGLGQMIALAYGTVPVVSKTGGLSDTVTNFAQRTKAGNGVVLEKTDENNLVKAIERTASLFKNNSSWSSLVKNAMSSEFSWVLSSAKYVKLYESAVNKHNNAYK